MPQVINSNIQSLNAQRNLNVSQNSLNTSLQRLSSGLRINSSKDDAAGLAVSERMSVQTRGMSVAIRNASDGLSLAQTAEGGIDLINTHLQRMRELAVQSANGTYTTTDRELLAEEFNQLGSEIIRVMQNTEFNGKKILNGSASGIVFQVGAGTSSVNQITVQVTNLSGMSGMDKITTANGLSISDASQALSAMSQLTAAMNAINASRARLGAVQSRFDGVVSQLQISRENQEASRSRIMDTDYAQETAQLARAQILQQAGTAMLAQANALPQNVLSLLR
ncbi:MAG: flagellin FliC [Rhodocyclaceae bacterium]|nr:flagellin FliC [Rhodocyclaceae bacterium]